MNEHIDLYSCSVCDAVIHHDEINNHPCMDECSTIVTVEASRTFYPGTADGVIIGQENTNDQDTASTPPSKNKEGIEEILIELVKERPPLWNYRDSLPRERTNAARNLLWEEIRKVIDPASENPLYTVTFLRNKWKNLYDTYRSYVSKEKGKSGPAAKRRKPWRFMAHMSFLQDAMDLGMKTTVSNLQVERNADYTLSVSEELDYGSTPDTRPKRKRSSGQENYLQQMVDVLSTPIPAPIIQVPQAPTVELDEINHFCAALDKKLHRLQKDESDLAMYDITKYMYEYFKKK